MSSSIYCDDDSKIVFIKDYCLKPVACCYHSINVIKKVESNQAVSHEKAAHFQSYKKFDLAYQVDLRKVSLQGLIE